MIEILKSFEQAAGRFSPAVLVVPGLAMVALGLVAWLGGTCLRRLVPALLGAALGLLLGFFFGRQNSPAAIIAAGTGAVLGMILPRLLVAVLLAGLGVVIAFGVAAWAHPIDSQGTLLGAGNAAAPPQAYTVAQSLDALRTLGFDVADRIEAIARRLLPGEWAVIAAVGAGLLTLGSFFDRPAGALTYGMLGTALVFAGLTTLLIFKGSAPVAHVERQGPFYGIVFLGMAAFGTLEQLVLYRPIHREEAPSGKGRAHREEAKHGWRNR